MTRYSVQSREIIFLKGYGYLYFTKNMGKNIGKDISKGLNKKYNHKHVDYARQFATDAFKTCSNESFKKLRKQPQIYHRK